ncbi:tetratricopeptide repeat protein [Thermoflexibacter ruber]|uniref:Tetratricopeptide repeat-containing protein n=1 Tax=Thermoflexibacter ruber TaxID=1003 RepID=A0A1I2IKJ3_9BACT|nr:tetratricopeptide repeat protein [Thermoflexibacter ruber]SFF42849.1 Tetratricopeptide repeat-containing protein [Thermoflexibacter ruber]
MPLKKIVIDTENFAILAVKLVAMALKKLVKFIVLIHISYLLLTSCQPQTQEQAAPLPTQEEERLAKQISYMNEVIEDYPNVADYYFRRAVLNLEAKKENLAQRDIDQAIALDSNKAEYYFVKAKTHEIKEEYDKALTSVKKAEEKGFVQIEADMLMGKMYYHAKDFSKAMTYLGKVQEILPNLAEVHYYRGLTYFQTQDTTNAVSYLNKAIELKKDYKEAYRALIDLYNNYGAYKIALRYTSEAIRNCEKDAYFYYAHGRALWNLKSIDSAMVLYSQAFDLDATIWQAGYQLGLYCVNKKNYVKAEQYLSKVLVQKPDIEQGHYLLAAIYEYHLKQLTDALRHYQRAQLMDKENEQIAADIRRVVRKIEYEEYKKSPQYMLDLLRKQKEEQLQQLQKRDSL